MTLRRFQYVVCAMSVLLVYDPDHPRLFYFAVAIAFTNIFSSQIECLFSAYAGKTPGSFPQSIATWAICVNRLTGIAALLILIYAVSIKVW
jgi:hypothetical protein